VSGHSKWSQIKRKKGALDQKRGALFSRMAKEIVVAAKQGGGNPDSNVRLRTAIDRARAVSMPNDPIEKAILRGTGQLPGLVYEEVTYEGYGPGGIAVIVECLTESRNRTTSSLRHAFSRNGGHLGETGCVSYLFQKRGVITVARAASDPGAASQEDALLEAALEAGADDVETQTDYFQIKTAPSEVHAVAAKLKAAGVPYESAEIALIPSVWITPTELAPARAAMRLISELEDDDDVQNVHSNFEPPAELLSEE
jgi:YebC/PmpR family DNA-binding regulatory protein